MKSIGKHALFALAAAVLLSPLFGACGKEALPSQERYVVPEGMVEVRPVLTGSFGSIPRDASDVRSDGTRAYPSSEETNKQLNDKTLQRLSEGSTVWLIARNEDAATKKVTYVKKSYVVYNSEEDATKSFLIPCTVDTEGEVTSMEGSPFFLKEDMSYTFYAVSPARALDETKFAQGTVGFPVRNGEAFYANDCRYAKTTPETIKVESTNSEAVQLVELKPMMNQTALLRFRIGKGDNVHDLDIQPSGIQISGLQNDDIDPEAVDADGNPYGGHDGLYWHMSQTGDEPFSLRHGDKTGTYYNYDYTIDEQRFVCIDVPVLPMWSVSKPVIVVFRLKVNGVPTAYEMMLNEKDFKAGYSYGYRGKVSIVDGVTVITWQYVSWEYEVNFPDFNL